MFAEYLQAVMRHAYYEQIEDGAYFGAIDELPGSWASAPTLEGRQQAMEAEAEAEDWILFAIALHQELPEIDGHKLLVAKAGSYCRRLVQSSDVTRFTTFGS